jgi:lipopolysaccharide transport system permease protein
MTLVANSGLFKKVFFPRIILPLAYCFSSLVSMGIQIGVLILFGFLFWMKGFVFQPSLGFFFLPVLLIHLMVLSFGLGLWLAALSMRYRDFHYLWGLVSPLWLYATPVSYPLSAIPPEWKWVVELNPLTALVEGFRMGLLGIGEFNLNLWGYSLLTTVILAITGVVFFQKVERDCVDSF